jgi:hypothetical protein
VVGAISERRRPICRNPKTAIRLNYIGEKAGFGWRQNALRHSFAGYRLAAVQRRLLSKLEIVPPS